MKCVTPALKIAWLSYILKGVTGTCLCFDCKKMTWITGISGRPPFTLCGCCKRRRYCVRKRIGLCGNEMGILQGARAGGQEEPGLSSHTHRIMDLGLNPAAKCSEDLLYRQSSNYRQTSIKKCPAILPVIHVVVVSVTIPFRMHVIQLAAFI